MKVLNWKYLVVAGVIVLTPLFLLAVSSEPSWEKQADSICWAIVSPVGMVLGTVIFRLMTRLRIGFGVRVASATISGAIGAIAGIALGFIAVCPVYDSLVFRPHPDQYHGDLAYLFLVLYGAIFTGTVAFIFGFGPGLPGETNQAKVPNQP